MQRWKCSKCERSHTSDVIRLPVRCRCGAIDRDGATVRDETGEPAAAAKPPARKRQRIVVECSNRGEVLRTELCPSCKGRVEVMVFACAKHGECVLGKGPPGVHVCDGGAET